MEFKKIIKNFRDISGYIGCSILSKTGEIAYIDEHKSIDMAFSSSIFNDTFRQLNRASQDIGLTKLIRLEAQTDEGIVFLLYGNSERTIFAIFEAKGNISLAKMVLSKLLKKE